MKIITLKSTLCTRVLLSLLAVFLNFSSGYTNLLGVSSNAQPEVVLDAHSAGNGSPTWTITTTHPNELIIISAGGYGTGGNTLHTTPGTITVNGNNATYITRGQWLNFNFTWVCQIWAYVAPTPGVYNCACTELSLNSPWYFNFASSVYQPNCPLGLGLNNIIVGGNDSNHGPTTITASITTTVGGAWVYGTVDNNDNGATGIVAWNGQLTETDHTYISNGVDGAQADSTYANAGTYAITSTDIGASNVWMTIALIAVQPNPSCCALTAKDTVLANVLCNGGNGGSAYGIPDHGHTPYTYSWSPGGQTTDTATGLTAGTYTVTISDTIACSATAQVTITQPALLTCSITPNNILCFGGTGSEVGRATGGTTPYTYSWSTSPAQTNSTATALTVGTYTLNVTDAHGCTSTASASITQPAAPLAVTLSGPAIVCHGSSGTLTANASGGTTPYAYDWIGQNINPSNTYTATINPATQTDTIKITDANGCTATAEITVNLGPNMTVSIVGPSSICNGLSTTLCANVQGGTGGNIYSWQSPVNAITPCVSVSPTVTTTYSLNVFDNCGTEATATFNLRVNPLPTVAFTSSLFEGCAPLCVQFYNTTTLAEGKAATYLWTFGTGDSSKIASPIYCYSNSGNYGVDLTVTSDSGCSSTLTKLNLITAFTRPNGAFIYTPQSINIIDPTVQFTNLSTDAYNIIYWKWSFGDNSDSTSNFENPSYTYQDTGSYCVSMITMDVHGCTDTVTSCLVVEPSFNLYIPSAFTPNGDTRNPTFAPKGDYIKSFEMYIFDRWGMQIYHTKDITQGWDGTMNGGSVAQEDTYIYKIMVTDAENHQHTYVGNVTLLK